MPPLQASREPDCERRRQRTTFDDVCYAYHSAGPILLTINHNPHINNFKPLHMCVYELTVILQHLSACGQHVSNT